MIAAFGAMTMTHPGSASVLPIDQAVILPGDFDGNGIVDLTDYYDFQVYMAGPDQQPVFNGWEAMDLEGDSDVDFGDFAIFQNLFTGHDLCLGGTCVECLDNADCIDADVCTTETCEADHTCTHTPVSGCCNVDADCDDGLACTADACQPGHSCMHTQIPGCVTHTFATFTDSVSGFSTQEVRDVNDEIIKFDTVRNSIVYVATGVEYQVGFWPVFDNFLGSGAFFEVRFGTVLGEHRAYFTETGSATICNFVVSPASFQIFATSTQVPHT